MNIEKIVNFLLEVEDNGYEVEDFLPLFERETLYAAADYCFGELTEDAYVDDSFKDAISIDESFVDMCCDEQLLMEGIRDLGKALKIKKTNRLQNAGIYKPGQKSVYDALANGGVNYDHLKIKNDDFNAEEAIKKANETKGDVVLKGVKVFGRSLGHGIKSNIKNNLNYLGTKIKSSLDNSTGRFKDWKEHKTDLKNLRAERQKTGMSQEDYDKKLRDIQAKYYGGTKSDGTVVKSAKDNRAEANQKLVDDANEKRKENTLKNVWDRSISAGQQTTQIGRDLRAERKAENKVRADENFEKTLAAARQGRLNAGSQEGIKAENDAIDASREQVKQYIKNAADTTKEAIKTAATKVKEGGQKLVDKIGGAVNNQVQNIQNSMISGPKDGEKTEEKEKLVQTNPNADPHLARQEAEAATKVKEESFDIIGNWDPAEIAKHYKQLND